MQRRFYEYRLAQLDKADGLAVFLRGLVDISETDLTLY